MQGRVPQIFGRRPCWDLTARNKLLIFAVTLHTVVLCFNHGNGFFSFWAVKVKNMPLPRHACRVLWKSIFTLSVPFPCRFIGERLFYLILFYFIFSQSLTCSLTARSWMCCGQSWSGFRIQNSYSCVVCYDLFYHVQMGTHLPCWPNSMHIFFNIFEFHAARWISPSSLESEPMYVIIKTSFLTFLMLVGIQGGYVEYAAL